MAGKRQNYYATMSPFVYPFYSLIHPADGFQEMKYNRKECLPFGIGVLIVWYITTVLKTQYKDFVFNLQNPDEINIIILLISTLGIFMIATIANWSVTTLMDGEGSFKEIVTASAYALIPVIFSNVIVTVFSKFLSEDEGVFLNAVEVIAWIWTALLLVIALAKIHDFTFGKTLSMLALTALGVAIIVFLGVLVYSLYQQVSSFIVGLYYEIIYRFFS
ncbi:MAG: YIP1 family protein [Clostridia bacterium]|nr:YIP1 family protein [Clostridia bacterium]